MTLLTHRRGDSVSRPAPNARPDSLFTVLSPSHDGASVRVADGFTASCPSCGAPARLLIAPGILPSKVAVHRCRSCSLDFLSDAPDDRYWDTAGQDAIYDDPSISAERLCFFSGILTTISRLSISPLPPGEGQGEGALHSLSCKRTHASVPHDVSHRHSTAPLLSCSTLCDRRSPGEGRVRVPSHSSHPSNSSHVRVSTLLDIGAGKGEFALLAATSGFAVSILEPSSRATAGLSEKGVREVFNCSVEDFAPPREYDCVTLLDLLEHTRDPRATLRKAASCLAPGGILVILTPDGASVLRRFALALGRASAATAGILKYQYYLPHYSYANLDWMRKAAPLCGLAIVAVEHPATPKRFLLAKLHHHYRKYAGNHLLSSAVNLLWPLACLGLGNKLLIYLRKVR